MIGLEFKYNKNYSNIFNELLKGIDSSKYACDIQEFEIIFSDFTKIDENKLNLEKLINEKKEYQAISANIRLFLKDSEFEKIDNYNDFKNSDCQLIILISDVFDVEIYLKDNELKDLIIQNLKENNISYKFKTKDNDGRNVMYVN